MSSYSTHSTGVHVVHTVHVTGHKKEHIIQGFMEHTVNVTRVHRVHIVRNSWSTHSNILQGLWSTLSICVHG